MADTVDRTIYKLEIDDSDYIAGVDSMVNSTKKLTDQQERTNKTLQTNQEALKKQSEFLQQTKKDLESYTGSNEQYRKQLEKSFNDAQADNLKLTQLVDNNRKAYEQASKAANDFAIASQQASKLQQQTTQGKIPTQPPLGIITPQVSAEALNQLPQVVQDSTDEFEQLRQAIALADKEMAGMNQESEEFKTLQPIVNGAKDSLASFEDVAAKTGQTTLSLRSQIRQGREELVRLEQAGEGTSKTYIELEKNVARLTDEFGDQQERIKVLASDTRLLDFGKAAITSATSAFQAYTSVSILAGGASEELQKKTLQLFAAMQLLTSLEQLANTVKRGGVISTNLQSAAQATYTAVVGASTGALRAFRLALLGTGIGAAIIGIAALVIKWKEYSDATREAEENQKLLNEVVQEANQDAGKQIADLKILTQAAQDNSLTMKERLAAVTALQKEFPDYFGNLSQEAILTGDITEQTNALTLSIQAAARARAAKGKIDKIEADRLDLQFKSAQVNTDLEKAALDKQAADRKDSRDAEARGLEQFGAITKAQQLRQQQEDIKAKDASLQRQEDFLTKFVGLDKIAKTVEDKGKGEADKKVAAIQNEFARKKAELDARLAALTRQEADNESKIRVDFAARLAKEQLEIQALLNAKKVTPAQAEILKAENVTINNVELDKALSDLNKKITDARKKLNDEISDLQQKAALDSINLIQDEFDRRAQLIEFNEKKQLDDSKQNTDNRLAALDLQRLLIGEQAYQDDKNAIIANGEQESLNIIARANQERQDLAADSFDSLLSNLQNGLEERDVQAAETLATQLQEERVKLNEGLISRKQFEENVNAITRAAVAYRANLRRIELNQELDAIKVSLEASDDAKVIENLKKRALKIRAALAELDTADATAKDGDQNTKEKTDTVQQYAEAIGSLAQSIVGFWQKANEAEAAALDRSIALQEQRVDAAQRIAERGNAQYLKAETDRLKELQVARENAARRDLAINAALQASQLLVGITGAISKIATPGVGIAETIGAIAVIVASLASGFALARSLQGNQPKLAKGTKRVRRDGAPAGTDTIAAWLNEDEAVIPAHRNKAYHPAVEAIYDGTIPAEHLNNFVRTYHRIRKAPSPNYDRIREAAEMHVSQDGRLAGLLTEHSALLKENNDLQRKILGKKVHIEQKMDRDGLSQAVTEFMDQKEKDKRL